MDCCGVRKRPQARPENATLYYGRNPTASRAKLVVPINDEHLFWDECLQGGIKPESVGRQLPFDLVTACGRLLADTIGHSGNHQRLDSHGRLSLTNSLQFARGCADLPPVNVYLTLFRCLLERLGGVRTKSFWPPGKKCAIALSHDVDWPDKYALLRSVKPPRDLHLVNLFRHYLKWIRHYARRCVDPFPDEHWLFDEIVEAEQLREMKSTLFFASMNIHGKWGSRYDVDYDIRSPKFRKVFEMLRRSGFEIGLHAGYETYSEPGRFSYEKSLLEQAAGCEVFGIRHHFWHLGPNILRTLRCHENAGFTYDSSLAFEDAPGFRRNVAMPFYIWDGDAARPLQTIQMPAFCMDSQCFCGCQNSETGLSKIRSLIGTIKAYEGFGSINWHVRTSHPKSRKYHEWGKTYLEILDLLAADSEIWVTTLGQIASYSKERLASFGSERAGAGS